MNNTVSNAMNHTTNEQLQAQDEPLRQSLKSSASVSPKPQMAAIIRATENKVKQFMDKSETLFSDQKLEQQ
jgi:hypothetical protein